MWLLPAMTGPVSGPAMRGDRLYPPLCLPVLFWRARCWPVPHGIQLTRERRGGANHLKRRHPGKTAMLMQRLHESAKRRAAWLAHCRLRQAKRLGFARYSPASATVISRARTRLRKSSAIERSLARSLRRAFYFGPSGCRLGALLSWLRDFPALPDAASIRAIVIKRMPGGTIVPPVAPEASLGTRKRDCIIRGDCGGTGAPCPDRWARCHRRTVGPCGLVARGTP